MVVCGLQLALLDNVTSYN